MSKQFKQVVIMVDSAARYADRRAAIRSSWFRFLHDASPFLADVQANVAVKFVVGIDPDVQHVLEAEILQYGDIVQVDVIDSYDTILRKLLRFLPWVASEYDFEFFMHADDDSFVRLDLLLEVIKGLPRQKVWWGYMWNLPGSTRITRPLRNPAHKSYMPVEQHADNSPYPTFASGCGFLLSADLTLWLMINAEALPDYRLVDAGCGLYLAAFSDINFIHSDLVRPYRPLPMFRADSIVQHYMRPEEFRGFYQHAVAHLQGWKTEQLEEDRSSTESLYDLLARAGVMRR
eukprot:TRINITY_DN15764_c0_g1_i1.p1 TRINITY_DN15764_c0_g1~~TRINITY_DN15764_c0_g1_i1.p1  ORF type:complete len:298 (-),score=32.24 TRINITY_DN15764_c0_g1_i1:110-976(-)